MKGITSAAGRLTDGAVREACAEELANWSLDRRRVLAVVPDGTRTAPIDVIFPILHDLIAPRAAAFDVLIALGTHPPMTEQAINARLGISADQRRTTYARTKIVNHDWMNPSQLRSIGVLDEDEVSAVSGGRLCERVNVTINRLALEYDVLLIVGPTFPHEVVGYSGGNKYLFPGISGREIIDMFHWLGALLTNPDVIGRKYTPVRAIVDRAAGMVPVERRCVSLVVDGRRLVGLYLGSPEEAWSVAADHSSQIHVRREPRAYRSVLSSAPPMYEDLWVGGKCAYKLEPVVADGGELIIYAPHITRLSTTHGEVIRRIGYHVRDYFLCQMDRFAGVPRGVMAHATHVKGVGSYVGGVERARIEVILATQISEAECRAVNLGYRDFRGIDVTAWQSGGDHLYVSRAGETLFRLADGGALLAPQHGGSIGTVSR